MIVRISILDTIFNLYKSRITSNCIKIVSNIQFLTFCDRAKMKKGLNLSDLALSLCCLGRIRTLTGGTRIRRATITPQGNFSLGTGGSLAAPYRAFASAKLCCFFYSCKFFRTFFRRFFRR